MRSVRFLRPCILTTCAFLAVTLVAMLLTRPSVSRVGETFGAKKYTIAAPSAKAGTLAVPNDYDGRDIWTDVPSGQNWHHELIRLPNAWDTSTGSDDTVLTIIDYDIQPDHPDLAGNHLSTSRLAEGLPSSESHGTAVAGIACAQGNDAVGITGAAWDCGLRIWDVRRLGDQSPGALAETDASISVEDIVLAMNDAVDSGSAVVNLSLGGPHGDGCDIEPSVELEQEALRLAALFREPVERARQLAAADELASDIVWVFAAGNGCKNVTYSAPAKLATEFDNVITVTAVNSDGSLAPFANFGDGVDVAAGGGFDLSAMPADPTPEQAVEAWRGGVFTTAARTVCQGVGTVVCSEEFGYRGYAGTSMAAPSVAGLAVLIRATHPDFTAADTVRCITESAQRFGQPVSALPDDWFTAARSTGWSLTKRYTEQDLAGLHVVDATAAVACENPAVAIVVQQVPTPTPISVDPADP